ncbi:MAG: GNAT family N-acetyltransferase [Pseudomonas piscis]|uniref:GNAT family N-acetyltransferase n=1 Tax=Pseudomonas piscis TaxID=2614538 RepID=UPI003D2BACF3
MNASETPTPLPLHTERLVLRSADQAQAPALQRYLLDNREHLAPWEPLRDEEYFQLAAVAQRLGDMAGKVAAQEARHWLLFDRAEQRVLGACNFTNIVRGAFQACHLGFALARHAQGRGLMHEALQAAIGHAFDELQLHRVMANHRPENLRSAQLLARLGFEQEGRARAYLKINGEWADHVLTALINPRSM